VKYEVAVGGRLRVVELVRLDDEWQISIDGNEVAVGLVEVAPHTFSVLLNGESHQIRIAERPDGTLTVYSGIAEYHTVVTDPRLWRGRRHGALEVEGRQQITAPMPGKVVRVLVQEGVMVEAGQGLLVVEAMKMQNELRSPKSGRVEKLFAKEGLPVNAGDVLAWVE
jgi:biotin carboxyl carrier protein